MPSIAAAGTNLERTTPNKSVKLIKKYRMPFSLATFARLTLIISLFGFLLNLLSYTGIYLIPGQLRDDKRNPFSVCPNYFLHSKKLESESFETNRIEI
jgi:hypothetical protein